MSISSTRSAMRMLGAVLAFSSSTAALAQALPVAETDAAEAGADGGLRDIIVTAQKRETNLQTTPISISVMSADELTNRHVQSLLDLGDGAIPSLRVAPFFSRSSALIMNVRGIGVLSDSNQPARDQGVGVYIDGVYLGRAQGLGAALYDIESIEVLKGPQGTLFGRNTEGGAVSIVTKKPSGEFKMNTTAGFGNFGSYKAETHIDLPAFQNIAIKLDALVSRRDGLVENPLAGQEDFNQYDKQGLHAEARWSPTSNFTADYSFDTSYDASTPMYLQSITAGSLARGPLQVLQPTRARVANIGVPQQLNIGRTHGHLLTLEWEASSQLTLKSISSYRKLSQGQYDNALGNLSAYRPNGAFARYSLAQFGQTQYSHEVQAIGNLPEVSFVAGALYYKEKAHDNAQAFNTLQWNANGTGYTVLPLVLADQRIDRASRVTTESIGAFGQATYTPSQLNDVAHLTIGARYTRDKKAGELFIINGALPNVDGVVGPRTLNASWNRVDPLINLAVDLSRDVHVYGKWSTGYKAGGANSRSLRYAPFNPETVSMFEIGAKTEFFDRRARLNIAAYTGVYKAIQIDFNANFLQRDANGNLLTNNRTTTETANAPGSGRLKGFEADLTLMPVTGLTLTANYAYNSVTIPATVNPFPQGASGTIITTPVKIYPVYTPKNAASGSIDYELPLGGVTLRAHLDANYSDGFYTNYNDPEPGLSQPLGDSAFLVNGRLALADIEFANKGANLTLSVWARNLFNEQHLFLKATSSLLGSYGIYNEPRTLGVEANLKF